MREGDDLARAMGEKSHDDAMERHGRAVLGHSLTEERAKRLAEPDRLPAPAIDVTLDVADITGIETGGHGSSDFMAGQSRITIHAYRTRIMLVGSQPELAEFCRQVGALDVKW